MQRKKGPPSAIKTDISQHSRMLIALGDPTSASDSDHASSPRPRSLRNMKKLSLTLPSAQSSSLSLNIPSEPSSAQPTELQGPRPRRPSVTSLPPNPTAVSFLQRSKEHEGGDPTIPYADGPIQIIPGIWLGSEDNARDWTGLIERGIKAILNVAKEVASPFDSANPSQTLRSAVSTPNLNKSLESAATYHPPHPATGRPGLHYLKLMWSHGQRDLVTDGFPAAMNFTDEALNRGEGVLIHCQCGISRSATLTIAIVMRAAAERSPSVPSEIWALKGMQPAYDYVKEKSKWIGPNMSLIYQLLDYERKLKGSQSPSSDRSSMLAEEEAEWSRRRQMLEDESDDDHESRLVMQEAQALDKAMEDRIVARKSSASSVGSSLSGVGMGAAWRSRYSRKRAGSVASNTTNGSLISEDLVEEEEEQALLGVGGGFESDGQDPEKTIDDREQTPDNLESSTSSSTSNSPEDIPNHGLTTIVIPPLRITSSSTFSPFTPRTARPRPTSLASKFSSNVPPPPSAPVWKTSFGSSASLPPPRTAFRPSFDLSTPKAKKRPTPLGSLSAIPPSPISIIVEGDVSSEASETESVHEVPLSPKTKARAEFSRPPSVTSSYSSVSSASSSRRPSTSASSQFPSSFSVHTRTRTESRRPAPPPLHLRNSVMQRAKEQTSHSGNTSLKPGKRSVPSSQVSTPSQTLFVFPPSPTLTTRTPSTMTLTSAATPRDQNIPFPTLATPRVATFRGPHGKTRSFIGLGPPPTPTTGFSRVDVRGYVGLE
ncbi:hypothetical protein BT96DRAFT_983571 [Gymnopus androsaceus JB14]|uniref:protein-tyrosine-phosphatase n=1 Tax=Gymnopus androsaceus JB14 TaxID=1447944 RepID=A0A6A4IF10_9AGAR|nr:hypothetical protein BT96DRAFT_983571 [Gymnopus androsaceus JB14]